MDNHFSIFRIPDKISITTEKGVSHQSGAQTCSFHDIKVSIENGAVYLESDKTPVKSVVLQWAVAFPSGTLFSGDHWERGYGDFSWRKIDPNRLLPWYFFAYSDSILRLYGVKLHPDALCAFLCDSSTVTLCLDVGCGSDGTVLSGRKIKCADIIYEDTITSDPFNAASLLIKALTDTNVCFPSSPVYGYNNWYYAYGESTAQETEQSAAELHALTEGLTNRPYLVIDDCWQENRKYGFIGGSWRKSNIDFPDMQALAKIISDKDIHPGIWMRPLQNKEPEIPAACYRDCNEFILDPSLPETLNYISDDIKTLTGWGYQLIKHDYSTYDILGDWGNKLSFPVCRQGVHFSDKSKTTSEIIKNLYRTIFEAANGKALILGCNTIGHLGAGYMQLARTGDDTSGRDWERTKKMGVNTLAFRMPQHNVFFAADADCVGITPAVPWEKNRQWLDLLANSGTPLFISVAPGSLTKTQYAEIRKAFETASLPFSPAVPLDWMETECPARWRTGHGIKEYQW